MEYSMVYKKDIIEAARKDHDELLLKGDRWTTEYSLTECNVDKNSAQWES